MRQTFTQRQVDKRKSEGSSSSVSPKKTRRSMSVRYDRHMPRCIVFDMCDDGTEDKMHRAQTQIVGDNLKENVNMLKTGRYLHI